MESAKKSWIVFQLLTEVSNSMQQYYFNRNFSKLTLKRQLFL